ncbi:MAG: hypothetical protein AAGB31_00795 [Bdellovibrio sp.]
MSHDESLIFLEFPFHGSVPPDALLCVRDLDVVGVDARRKRQLENLKQHASFVLQTHEKFIPSAVRSLYDHELLQTLQWLRPLQILPVQEFSFQVEQKKTFSRLFPLTQVLLGETASRIAEIYSEELEWSHWLLQDHWRYFPGSLRRKFPQHLEFTEVAQWEWVQASLEIQPLLKNKKERHIVSCNPSLHIAVLTEERLLLQREKGVYAFVYRAVKDTVVERKLDAYEAQIIDVLQEDRKYTREQLIQRMTLDEELPSLSRNEWEKKVLSLCQDGIIEAEHDNRR